MALQNPPVRSFMLIACLALTLVLVSPGNCSDTLRAHYEINVQDSTDRMTVRMASDLTPGAPIEHYLGKYRLALVIDVVGDNAYILEVSLFPKRSVGDTVLEGVFNGLLAGPNAGPLEFEVEEKGARVSGAIMVSSMD